jgi:ethanolamine utilization cobalamin adenosyltransferase
MRQVAILPFHQTNLGLNQKNIRKMMAIPYKYFKKSNYVPCS